MRLKGTWEDADIAFEIVAESSQTMTYLNKIDSTNTGMERKLHPGHLTQVLTTDYSPGTNMDRAWVFFLADFPKLSPSREQKCIISLALNNARLSPPLKPAQLRVQFPRHWEDK